VKRFIAVIVILAGLGYGGARGYDWYNWQVNTPVSNKNQPVIVRVTPGEGYNDVADELESRHLIRNRDVFIAYAKYTGARGTLQAGDIVLNRNMNMRQIIERLGELQPVEQIAITVPEGLTVQKTADLVEQRGIAKAADYLAAVKDTAWTQDFLAGRPARPDMLEGYLYPETYSLDKGSGAKALVKLQLDQFGRAFGAQLRQEAGTATAARPAESMDNIVILASLVEREVNRDPDRARVCSVIYNRLKRDMPLEIDATVLYALGVWKKQITLEDLKVNSPYNTYQHKGLPPGPIANPGAAAIKACVNPEVTDYLFYFTDKQGMTHFDRTLDEFERDKQKYGVSGY
jgi:UPF0755 protein